MLVYISILLKMSRNNTLLAILCVWVAIITLLPLYLLFTGYFSVARKTEYVRDPVMGEPGAGALQKLKRGVHAAENWPESDLEGEEDAAAFLGHPAVRTVGSAALRKELEEAIFNDEHSTHSRAAFELVVALSCLLPKISNISRIRTPSSEAFRNYIAPVGLPVIFTDMLEGKALGKWTWDYIKSKWGDTVFHNTRQGKYSTKTNKYGKHYVNRVSVKLADFVDVVTGRRAPNKDEKDMYITKQRVIPPAALEEEFYYPPFYPGQHKKCYLEPTGWIGSPGTFTQGHLDSKDNFVYQIIGEKRWTIFSPQDYKYLYYTKTKGSLEWSSVLSSLDSPNLTKYPLFSKATPITFTMKAGEVLYLPRGWTHRVENVTPALMINVWRYGPAAITEYWSTQNRNELRQKCF